MSHSKILFFTTGSIAAIKAAQVVSQLVKDGDEVQCVATKSALNFVGTATWEGLTGKKVLSDLWEEGHAMDHIHLTRDADFGVVCPATAHVLAKMALGLADDLVTSALLAWPAGKPLFIFPSMNTAMLNAPTTQEHIKSLRARGFFVADTGQGVLACGENGEGRLLEPERILKILKPAFRGRILITGGATRESVDGIRFLSNVSTGQTAADLCDEFSRAGFEVTYLHGREARKPKAACKAVEFSSAESLEMSLRHELQENEFDAVIHAAAVSDYTIASVNGDAPNEKSKLSSAEGLSLSLKSTRKLLPLLKEFSRNKDIRVVGFKLTLGSDDEEQRRAVGAVLSPTVDAIVANDWANIDHRRNQHPGQFWSRGEKQPFSNHREMAQLIMQRLKKEVL